MNEKILVIDNVRSAHNVGSLFRTADGAGVSRIYIVGYTPAPIDRFGRVQQEIAKTSLGATENIPWEQIAQKECDSLVTQLKEEGFTLTAVEQTPGATSIYDFAVPEKVAYIVGNEIDGVSPFFLKHADGSVEIPMHGQKESLNVSVAGGIVLFKK